MARGAGILIVLDALHYASASWSTTVAKSALSWNGRAGGQNEKRPRRPRFVGARPPRSRRDQAGMPCYVFTFIKTYTLGEMEPAQLETNLFVAAAGSEGAVFLLPKIEAVAMCNEKVELASASTKGIIRDDASHYTIG